MIFWSRYLFIYDIILFLSGIDYIYLAQPTKKQPKIGTTTQKFEQRPKISKKPLTTTHNHPKMWAFPTWAKYNHPKKFTTTQNI